MSPWQPTSFRLLMLRHRRVVVLEKAWAKKNEQSFHNNALLQLRNFAATTSRGSRGSGGVSKKPSSLSSWRKKKKKKKLAGGGGGEQRKAAASGNGGSPKGNKNQKKKTSSSSTTTATSATEIVKRLRDWLHPTRFRSRYTQEQAVAVAWRIPLWFAVAGLLSLEEVRPYGLDRISGPSMLPAMMPDSSEIWLIRNDASVVWRSYDWLRKKRLSSSLFGYSSSPVAPPYYKRGEVIRYRHPDFPEHPICKRVVGVAGDRVRRYGEYVHLYVDQDPERWGIRWPVILDGHRAWMDPSSGWDDKDDDDDRRSATATTTTMAAISDESSSSSSSLGGGDGDIDVEGESRQEQEEQEQEEWKRTVVVPEDRVWIEGDNPFMSIDSRHFGPIPVAWLTGGYVARVWPFWKLKEAPDLSSTGGRDWLRKRPHPIPLDEENLKTYNCHRIKQPPPPSPEETNNE